MTFRRSLLLLISCLAVRVHAQVVPVTYNFNDSSQFPFGVWVGGNGWTTTQSGGNFYVSNVSSPDGSNYIRFQDSGSGVGATAAIAFNAPASNDRFSLSFSYMTANYWGTSVGLGPSASTGLTLAIAQSEAQQAQLKLGGTTVSGGSVTFTPDSWHQFRVDIDLSANAGSGSASVFARATDLDAWSAISGMSNANLGLDATRTAADLTNPAHWDTLWFHHEGATSGIDNLSVSAIPEPSTYAALAGVAMMGFALWQRQRRRAV